MTTTDCKIYPFVPIITLFSHEAGVHTTSTIPVVPDILSYVFNIIWKTVQPLKLQEPEISIMNIKSTNRSKSNFS